MQSKNTQKAEIFNQLFEPKLSQGDKRMLKIIDGAIYCFSKAGFDGVTMDQLAKASDVSRPLLTHYFEDKHELFQLTIKRIRLNFQQMAIKAIEQGKNPTDKLKAYIDSTFEWVEEYPEHIRVWLLYFHCCSTNKTDHTLHSELTSFGHKRITALLKAGVEEGEFSSDNLEWKAKFIQIIITGALTTAVTEDCGFSLTEMKKKTWQSCLALVL